MDSIPLLSWLYDMVLDVECLRFVWFSFLTTSRLYPSNIEYVKELSRFSLGSFSSFETLDAQNAKNRLFGRCFL